MVALTRRGASGRRALFRRIRGAVERDGLPAAAGRGLRRMVAPLVETGSLVFFARALDERIERLAPTVPSGCGCQVREASAAELGAIWDGSDPERSKEALRERFRRGHLCFVAATGTGAIDHVRWVTTDSPRIPEAGRILRLAAGDVYFYDGFTRVGARRRGLDGLVRTTIFRTMRERGYRRAVSYVRADNQQGLRAARRWQEAVGSVRWVRLGRGRPWLLGTGAIAPLRFSPAPNSLGDEETLAERARGWRQWFDGWLEQPPARRSTGFSALPADYFDASADFLAGALELEAGDDTVLDVGCASGAISYRVAGRCRALVGVDATPGLVRDAARTAESRGPHGPVRFLGADGRRLPFADGVFSRVYCTGVIHTLPSREDGLHVIRELVRVCRPGGRVLVGALPDRDRRWRARAEVWRRGTWRDRIELMASVVLPRAVKRALRRLTRIESRHRLVALEYDLEELGRRIRGIDPRLRCRRLRFPRSFWSRDFRATRSNLLIEIPSSGTAVGDPVRTSTARPGRPGRAPSTGVVRRRRRPPCGATGP